MLEARERCNHQAYVGDSQSETPTTDNEKRETPKTVKKRFELWYRRFAHCDPEKLRYLHKVTDLKERIRIPSNARMQLPLNTDRNWTGSIHNYLPDSTPRI